MLEKRKIGRPRLPESEKASERISFRVKKNEYDAVLRKAQSENKTVTDLVKSAVSARIQDP